MNKVKAMQLLGEKKKGVWFKLKYTTEVKPTAYAKANGISITKETRGTFRVGINNNNRKEMKAKIAEGYIPQPRTWGKYVEDSDRFIEHTNKAGEHKYYVALYSTPNVPHVCYFVNGVPIKKKDLMETGYVPQSYFTSERTGVFTVDLANIDEVD